MGNFKSRISAIMRGANPDDAAQQCQFYTCVEKRPAYLNKPGAHWKQLARVQRRRKK